MTNENTEIVIAVFAGEDKAKAVLAEIDKTATSEIGSLHEQVTVLSLDADGKLSVKKPTKQQRTGAATGALVGVLVGAALGLPVVGAVLGGVVGARQASKKQKPDQDFSLDQATALMTPDSSLVVTEVVDGDTIELTDGHQVRYVGINTPEHDQPYYQEATEANRQLVDGKDVQLEFDQETFDKYGRTLAYIWVDGTMVNLTMLKGGFANA